MLENRLVLVSFAVSTNIPPFSKQIHFDSDEDDEALFLRFWSHLEMLSEAARKLMMSRWNRSMKLLNKRLSKVSPPAEKYSM